MYFFGVGMFLEFEPFLSESFNSFIAFCEGVWGGLYLES